MTASIRGSSTNLVVVIIIVCYSVSNVFDEQSLERPQEAVLQWRCFGGVDLMNNLLQPVQDLTDPFQLSQVILLTGHHCPDEHVALT